MPKKPVRQPAKPPRADAQRNRRRILEEAEKVFLAKGISASTEEVAKAADVGIGTVFRHFPTKLELVAAVHEMQLERVVELIQRLRADREPGDALFEFIEQSLRASRSKNAFAPVFAEAGIDPADLSSSVKSEATKGMTSLLKDSQKAGVVRKDLRLEDLVALMVGATRAMEYAEWDSRAEVRVLSVLIRGLGPDA